ncbi:complex I NDUFA9 subunit family protein [Nordella sp. HKS 07]|uniref:complex I NDUFA9 subunit family protein n=1 Tax=Nordella sp. HKS 07 TaxID=2712222 RepID=UPI0013E1118C|nr:complex I NDUFA9 subunit family protein [Nordella sp. HKS 07]QIG48638.1 complex I NDUFA9 subunit family protein [Nordella sp. HKS 07]
MTLAPSETLITLIGGSGFLGRHVTRALAKRGYRIRVACRRPDLAGHVQPLGVPGQIMPVQANVRYPDSLAAVCEGAQAVINLTGVLYSAGAQSFDAIHVFGAEATARAAKAAKAKLFIQMSAIGADAGSTSDYAKSKAEGEARARANFQGAIVLRPSIVFGPEDQFFNRFAAMARFSPALPLIGGGETKFQPVFVGDIARAVTRLIDANVASGKTYELGGPEVQSFRSLIDFTLETIGRKRLLVPVPWSVARVQGMIMGLLPKPLLTSDQVELLKHDNVVSPEAIEEGRTLQGLGITPRGIEAIVPSYLYRYRKAGEFSGPTGKPKEIVDLN